MKLAVLGPSESKSGYTTVRLLEEARKQFKKVDMIPAVDVKLKIEEGLSAVYGKEKLSDYDYLLPRLDSKRAEIGYPIISFLDTTDIRKPYKAETILVAHNKFLTLQKLVQAGVRVPKTYMTASKKSAKEMLDREKFPIMIKLLSGFGGMGVMFMESKDAAYSVVDTLNTLNQEICLEEFIENPGEDIRGIVAGDEIIASFKRVATKGEKRANVKLGGKAITYKLTPEMEEIVFKSAKAVGSSICAVDMIEGKNDVYTMEVNINPGLQGIEKATDLNVAQRIIDFIKNELKQ